MTVLDTQPKPESEKRNRGARFTDRNVREVLEFFPGLACCYRDGKALTMNMQGAMLLGYGNPVPLEDHQFDEFLTSEYANIGLIEHIAEDGMPCLVMMKRADGTKVSVEIRVQPARELGDGTLIVRAEDVSHRMALASDIHHSEIRFRSLVDHAMDVICACSEGKITFINQAGLSLLGAQDVKEIIGKPVTSMFHPDYHPVFEDSESLDELMDQPDLFPARFARIDGTIIDVQIALSRTDGSPDAYMLEARDITQHRNAVMALHQMNQELEQRVRDRTLALSEEVDRRRETEEKMRHMATHDGLTGLPNRRLLMEHLERALARAHRDKNKIAVVFIDLDGFKAVNDTYGHDAGDIVLKEASTRLLEQVRETDTVARLGGDEFLIAYTDLIGIYEAEFLAQRILEVLSLPFPLPGGIDGSIGASIGISIFPDDGGDVEAVMKAADEAMYEVKKKGKNNFIMASSLKSS
ncbi:MAG: diguanylate cyclase [Rhodospirillaceae bacterium]|nr:diguanylate cyclase [Rhodospirillaceae bacterium]